MAMDDDGRTGWRDEAIVPAVYVGPLSALSWWGRAVCLSGETCNRRCCAVDGACDMGVGDERGGWSAEASEEGEEGALEAGP